MLLALLFGFSQVAHPGSKFYSVPVENKSDCLIIFVSVVKMEFRAEGNLKEMSLYWAEWLEPKQKGIIHFEDGVYYGVLLEVYNYDFDKRIEKEKLYERYTEGKINPNESNAIRVHCKHTIKKDI